MQKLSLKQLPDEIVFDYALSMKRINEIKKSIRDIDPNNIEQYSNLKMTLKEYYKLFNKISTFNQKYGRI